MYLDVQAADGFPWDKVNAAKRYLYAVKPWWARFGEKLKVVPVYQPPIGNAPYGSTMSTDRQFRLYIDRGYALTKPLHILAGAIEHEFQQHTRDTFNRLRHLSDEDWAEFANISFNLEINGGMDAEQRYLEMDQVRIMCQKSAVFSAKEMDLWGVTAPPGLDDEGWIPRLIPLPDGMSAEEYFAILKKSKEEQEKREQEEREKAEQEQKEQEEQDKQDSEQDSDDTQADDSAEDGSEADHGDESAEDQEDESETGGNDEGADSDASDDESDESEVEDQPGEPGDSEGGDDSEDSQESGGSSTSDHKDEADPEDDAEANDASNGDEDLSDGGESDGSEDSAPEDDADANESDAKDGGSAGGNHSSQQKGSKKSDSKGDNGNASIAEDQDASGQEGGSEAEVSEDSSPEGQEGQEVEAEAGLPAQEEPASDRVVPTAEIADKVDALKEKLDQRLWSKEMENPTDELTASPWKPEERENEKPVDRTDIAEAMEMLEQDVTESSLASNFGLKPGNQIVNWVFRQQKVRGVDWQSKLSKLISSAYTSAKVSGASDLSYTVRNPNQPEFGAILQGLHDYAPTIMVVQDVSGSMRTGKRQSLAMSTFTDLCTKVLGTFNSKVTWVTVDTDIIDVGQASGWSKALQRKMSYGFGGTKIGPVIDRCMKGEMKWKGRKYAKPDLLIVVTDCAFDWPDKRPTKRGRILVVSVDANMSNVNFFLPRWLERRRELVVIR